MQRLWYKHAVIYCLDVETFQDSTGDGIGDFPGLTGRLDYLAGLGVTCVWLMPFYPTPNRDNGYDVTDYFSVDPRLGDLGDFVDFLQAAEDRGIRVIIDLVINHTSIEHPWFQKSRQSPDSLYRDYYVWKQEKPDDADESVMFPGVQETCWTYDRQAKAYYFHRFYKHQAELNIANPAVRNQMRQVMAFWLRLGVSGFRLDAAPYLIELKALEGVEVDEPYEYLIEFRDYLSWQRGDAILLAEANIDLQEMPHYFGEGNKLHMMFNFVLNQHVMYALLAGNAQAIREGLYKPPAIPEKCQWANFLRNHDEFPVGRLSESQQQEIFEAWAPDESMRVYDRGIRRRLPPMLGGDWKKLKLAHSLLLSLPGTPVIRYGEEIGMGDDLSLPERDSIRTPMQWSDEANGGFSTADRDACIRSPINRGKFRYQQVNVAEQRRDADSLLRVTEQMIHTRRENPELGTGAWQIVETGDSHVLGHRCDDENAVVVCVHNLSEEPRTFALDVPDLTAWQIEELLTDAAYDPLEDCEDPVEIGPLGYRWLRFEKK